MLGVLLHQGHLLKHLRRIGNWFLTLISTEVISAGINVNGIAPGLGDTNFLRTGNFPEGEIERALPRIPSGKTTTPQDVGNMVAYLASDMANNIVGQTFLVDGGMS